MLSASEMAWSWAEARAAKSVMVRSFMDTILVVEIAVGEESRESEGGLMVCRYGLSQKRGLHMAGMRMLLVHIPIAAAKSNHLKLSPLPTPKFNDDYCKSRNNHSKCLSAVKSKPHTHPQHRIALG